MGLNMPKMTEGWLKFSKNVKNTSTLKYCDIPVKLKQANYISVAY
jgi:hypothetical protein